MRASPGVAFLSLLAVLAAGCGGSAPEVTPPTDDTAVEYGGLSVRVEFPEARAELIPVAAQSAKVVFTNKSTGAELASRVLTPSDPATSVTGIIVGTVCTVTGSAHPNADGSGTAMASGSADVTVQSGVNASVVLSMSSTITSVEVTPAVETVPVGGTKSYTATAKDANGDVVMVAATWAFSVADTAVATVDADGVVTGVAGGTTVLTATESESGRSGTAEIQVPSIEVAPASVDLGVGGVLDHIGIAAGGAGTLSWQVTDDQTWLDVSPTSGTGSGTVDVSVERNGLADGTYTGTVAITSNGGNAQVGLTMRVFRGRIAWATDRRATWDIMSCLPDGSDQRTIQAANIRAPYIAWAPDFSQLAYFSPGATVVGVSGSPSVTLDSLGVDIDRASWSPDGLRIAYRDTYEGTIVVGADGSDRLVLPPGRMNLAWSPVGGAIAYVVTGMLCTMDEAGGSIQQLTTGTGAKSSPSWDPDGSEVAFMLSDGDWEIGVVGSDGTGYQKLTSNSGNDQNPTWSPDGSRIAFQSNRDGDDEIYVMNPDGSGQTRLTTSAGTDQMPVWSPDGRYLAFQSNRDGNSEIYAMAADGTDVTRLTNDSGQDTNPAWYRR